MFRYLFDRYYASEHMWTRIRIRGAVMLFYSIAIVFAFLGLFTVLVVDTYNHDQSVRITYNQQILSIPQQQHQQYADLLLRMSDSSTLDLSSWMTDSLRHTVETGTFAPAEQHAPYPLSTAITMLVLGFVCAVLLLVPAYLLISYAGDSYILHRHILDQPRAWSTVSFVLVTLLPFGWICYAVSAVRLWQTRHDGTVVSQTTST